MSTIEDLLKHPFIALIEKAEHIVVEKPKGKDYLIPNTTTYNGFNSIDEFNLNLEAEFEKFSYAIEEHLDTKINKIDRINLLNILLKEFDKLNRNTIEIKKTHLIHKNYNFINNLGDTFYKGNSINLCHDFIKTQYTYLSKLTEYIKDCKRVNELLTQDDINNRLAVSNIDGSKCLGIKKIKTNLTVEELAFFFKILQNIGILQPNNSNDLGKVVAELFQTNKKDNLSSATFMKYYYEKEPNSVAAKFIGDYLPQIKKEIEKYK